MPKLQPQDTVMAKGTVIKNYAGTNIITAEGAVVGDIQATAGSIGTAELADEAVTLAKIDRQTDATILVGKGASADVAAVAVSGDATLAASGAVTIAANAVTLTKFGRSDASGKIVIGQGASADSQYAAISGDATMDGSGSLSVTHLDSTVARVQATPTAKTTSGALNAGDILAKIVTVNQAAAGASAQQLPLASDLDTALSTFVADDSFDFSVINTSTVDAEDASITTNTGWTLVGSMEVHARSAEGSLNSSGLFRARKTGAGTWTLYRIA